MNAATAGIHTPSNFKEVAGDSDNPHYNHWIVGAPLLADIKIVQ